MRVVSITYDEKQKDFVFVEKQPIDRLYNEAPVNFVDKPKKKSYRIK